MARRTKLTDSVQSKLVKLISTGVTVVDACSVVGIGERTFYDWMERGETGDEAFAQFSQAVSRARNEAKVVAIGTLRTAMSPYKERSKTVETFTETRLTRDGNPYEYKRETKRETVTTYPGDWRAAVEYLKRRFRDEWSEKSIVEFDWRRELEEAGLNPDAELERLIEEFTKHVEAGAPADAGRGDGGGEAAVER